MKRHKVYSGETIVFITNVASANGLRFCEAFLGGLILSKKIEPTEDDDNNTFEHAIEVLPETYVKIKKNDHYTEGSIEKVNARLSG